MARLLLPRCVVHALAVVLVASAFVVPALAGGSFRLQIKQRGGFQGTDRGCGTLPMPSGGAFGYSLSQFNTQTTAFMFEDSDGVWRGLAPCYLLSNISVSPGYHTGTCGTPVITLGPNSTGGTLMSIEMRPAENALTPFGEWEIRWGKVVSTTSNGLGGGQMYVSTGQFGCLEPDCVADNAWTNWHQVTGVGLWVPIRRASANLTVYDVMIDQFVAPDGSGGGAGGGGTPPELDLSVVDGVADLLVPDASKLEAPSGVFSLSIPVLPLPLDGLPAIGGTSALVTAGWYANSALKTAIDAVLVAVAGMWGVFAILEEMKKGGGNA